jgi:putative intracellular protease/amidase
MFNRGNTGQKTGLWLEELATPYYVLKDSGIQMTLASPLGGNPPIDPKSEEDTNPSNKRFTSDTEAMNVLASTKKLKDMDETNFDAVFFVGGHGPLYDLAEDPKVFWLLGKFANAQKVIAAGEYI